MGTVDLVQLLSAAVDPSQQTQPDPSTLAQSIAEAATSLGSAVSAPSTSLGSASAALTGDAVASAPRSMLLLLTTGGAAVALAGTGWEGARRQRLRTARASGHGRRALR